MKMMKDQKDVVSIINLSGRGDKDMGRTLAWKGSFIWKQNTGRFRASIMKLQKRPFFL
jgi:hypothetical protein